MMCLTRIINLVRGQGYIEKVSTIEQLLLLSGQGYIGNLSTIEQAHFEESQFELHRQDGWKRLKLTAVPTIFDVPNNPQNLSNKRKKGIGMPKPGTLLDRTSTASKSETVETESRAALMRRVAELEAENQKLKLSYAAIVEDLYYFEYL